MLPDHRVSPGVLAGEDRRVDAAANIPRCGLIASIVIVGMPEILILCEYPTLNGGERSMLATLDGVRAAGFSPAVMAPPDGPLADGTGDSRHRVDPVSVPRGRRIAHRSEPAPRGIGRNSSPSASRSAARQQPGDGKTFRARWPQIAGCRASPICATSSGSAPKPWPI